jgi:hypothetical protein
MRSDKSDETLGRTMEERRCSIRCMEKVETRGVPGRRILHASDQALPQNTFPCMPISHSASTFKSSKNNREERRGRQKPHPREWNCGASGRANTGFKSRSRFHISQVRRAQGTHGVKKATVVELRNASRVPSCPRVGTQW